MPILVDILSFWRWAASSISGNRLKGHLAEFLVAVDLGVADGVRSEWDYEKQRRTDTKTRIADVYVFCLLAEVDQQKFDPTDLDQWEFYLLRTNEINEINEQLGTQKTLSLNRLRSLNPTVCRFGEIGTAVMQRVAIDKG